MTSEPATVHDLLGGQPFFDRLAAAFYVRVADDAILRPLYPEEDLGPAAARLAGFLAQYWGGPPHYSEARGHPRLRMRHAPFAIGEAERKAWLTHMLDAVAELDPPPPVAEAMVDYFTMAASHMVNQPAG